MKIRTEPPAINIAGHKRKQRLTVVILVKAVLVTPATIELLALAAPPETTEINYKSG